MSVLSSFDKRIRLFVDYLRTSFWVIPATLLALAAALAVVNLWLDVSVLSSVRFSLMDWMDPSKMEGIRALLSTTAAAILGVAGVSFSITIASLTLASQQFGPRLIRNFMQDRFTQTVLGFFVATFFYCMLTIQLGSVIVESAYTPVSTLITVLVLTIVDLLLLVLFIHHVCVAIQADTIISAVAEDMRIRADSLFSTEISDRTHEDTKAVADLENVFANEGQTIQCHSDGYIRAIDYDGLVEYAHQNDQLINVLHRAGDYVLTRTPLAEIVCTQPSEDLAMEINDFFVIGPSRNPLQDMEYSIRQLVEVALRALSPGINDPFTAITCINRLGTLLNMISTRAIPTRILADQSGAARLFINTTNFQGLVESAFNQIRQAACSYVDVTIRLLEVLQELIELASTEEQRRALMMQAEMIRGGVKQQQLLDQDEKVIASRFDDLKDAYSHRSESA